MRDVVRGHILAAEKNGTGRYILAANDPPDLPTVLKTMRKIDAKVPKALMIVPLPPKKTAR